MTPKSAEDIDDYLLPLKELIDEVLPREVTRRLGKYEYDKGIVRIWFKSAIGEGSPLSFKNSAEYRKAVGFIMLRLGGEVVEAGQNSRIEFHIMRTNILDLLHEAKNLEIAGNYEGAAQFYESLGAYEKAGELRRKGRTHYEISLKIGKDGVIKIQCPHCGASQPTESKSREVTCKYCGKTYIVPKKILDMI